MSNRNDETVGPESAQTTPGDSTVAPVFEMPESAMRLPTSIGTYRILAVIGRGGMGVVYCAEQATPKREVALKVIGSSYITAELLRRFRFEAETLGRLRHPGIAQIYEAGTADDGFGGVQAFFAMELIDGGLPLDAYAAAAKLDVTARLRLLCAICDAVQHAHQQGVIHRDLKPDNVLITPAGEPKIVDFGVARMTGADVRATATHTSVGQIIGTLPYMSPEQASGDPAEIDTRADIYALGAIGYELLSGRRPLALEKRALAEAVRVIREEEPNRLSSINRSFRGDVETIISKALAKEKERRYASASDLAADLRHFLSDEPISARPPSTWYQLSKFSKRNKVLVAGVAATIVSLAAGIVAASWFAMEANKQRMLAMENASRAMRARTEAERTAAESSAVVSFINDDIFGKATPRTIPDKNVRDTIVRVMLDPADARASERFKAQPQIEAAIKNQIAVALFYLGRHKEAEPLLRAVLATRTKELGAEHPTTLDTARDLSALLTQLNRADEAEPMLRSLLEVHERLFGLDHETTLDAKYHLASGLLKFGRPAEAEPLLRDHIARVRTVASDELPDSTNELATVLIELGRFREAEPLRREVHAARLRKVGAVHPETIDSAANLAQCLARLEAYEEAEQLFRTCVENAGKVFGAEHEQTLRHIASLAALLSITGRPAEAEPLLRDASTTAELHLGEDHEVTLIVLHNLADALHKMERTTDAEPLTRTVLERRRRVQGADHPDTLISLHNYGSILLSMNRLQEAEPLLREAIEARTRLYGWTQIDTLLTADNLATCLSELGRYDEAINLRRKVIAGEKEARGTNHVGYIVSLGALAHDLNAAGREAEAEPLFAEAARLDRQVRGPDDPATLATLFNHAFVLRKLGRASEALPINREVHQGFAKLLGPDHPNTRAAAYNVARTLYEIGQYEEAAPLFKNSLDRMVLENGEEHPDSKTYAQRYVACLLALKRDEEARAIQDRFALPPATTQASTEPSSQPVTP